MQEITPMELEVKIGKVPDEELMNVTRFKQTMSDLC